MVGARRPTVTLALRELTERGAIVRQDRGWLLLEAPPPVEDAVSVLESPAALLGDVQSVWAEPKQAGPDQGSGYVELLETVERLREEHAKSKMTVRIRLAEMQRQRERCQQVRAGLTARRREAGSRSA